jgi:hypothetical protein
MSCEAYKHKLRPTPIEEQVLAFVLRRCPLERPD